MIKKAYELGVQIALEEAGFTKEADLSELLDSTGKGFGVGALAGTGLSLVGLLTHLLSKRKYGLSPSRGSVHGSALIGGGVGAGIGALTGGD